jgi:RNA polymerase sigma-70 factor (ECF subfamily)
MMVEHKYSKPNNGIALDLQLAQAVARGDVAACRGLAERLYKRVSTTVTYLAGGDPDAQDYAQIAMIEILRSSGTYRGLSSLESWADRITVRAAMRQIKKSRWRAGQVALSRDPDMVLEPTAEQDMNWRRVGRRIESLTRVLPQEQRLVLTLRLVLDHSIEEIAHITQWKVNTVRDRLAKARRKLRQMILSDHALKEVIREMRLKKWL